MRIAIVNDLPLACEALRRVVVSVPGLEVAWIARDGAEAIELAKRDTPDLILMDLIMPRVDGVEATRWIMATHPCPILVVTATVSGRIDRVYEAMGHGALDAIDTPSLGEHGEIAGAAALLSKIATISKLTGKRSTIRMVAPAAAARPSRPPLVLLGASTGGPSALKEVLGPLPADFPASVVVVQHVDAAFAAGLAQWLGETARLPVELVQEGQPPAAGKVLVTCSNDHLVMDNRQRLFYSPEPREYNYRPSVDVFFQSVAVNWPEPGVAALLTGMGRDGAEGLLTLRRRGWHTIAQDRPSCVVWGMPRAAVECGAAAEVLAVQKIAAAVGEQVRKLRGA